MTQGYDSRRDRLDQPYVGIPSFLRAPICLDIDALDADIAKSCWNADVGLLSVVCRDSTVGGGFLG